MFGRKARKIKALEETLDQITKTLRASSAQLDSMTESSKRSSDLLGKATTQVSGLISERDQFAKAVEELQADVLSLKPIVENEGRLVKRVEELEREFENKVTIARETAQTYAVEREALAKKSTN